MIHLTMRAIEYLRVDYDPVDYVFSKLLVACSYRKGVAEVAESDIEISGVQDIRALMNGDWEAKFWDYDEFGRTKRYEPIMLPTCPECLVILDVEMELTKRVTREERRRRAGERKEARLLLMRRSPNEREDFNSKGSANRMPPDDFEIPLAGEIVDPRADEQASPERMKGDRGKGADVAAHELARRRR